MNQYEITIITKEPFDSAQGKNLKGEPAKKEIAALGGKVLNITEPDQRQFAYQVKKESSGYYTTIVCEVAPEKVLELNKRLGLNADVLRHLIITYKAAATVAPKPRGEEMAKPVKTEITAPPPEEIVVAKPAETEIISTQEAKFAKEVVPAPAVSEKEKKPKPVKKAIKKEEEPKKVVEEPMIKSREAQEAIQKELSAEDRLKALDKKLDELLKE